MSTQESSSLQHMLQSAVQGVQWTYSLFWQICPQQGILVWGDGYYNGAIKTRKTVQSMEVSTEEASLQRSQQLRELYDSLSAGETNQPQKRPCAALSPEDLTESEWFYLMCVSFSFPPGVGLPGKAFARRQHVWLTGANEADSKVFSRAILAKSARIQTLVCIPVMGGVLELGTTERVQEDLALVQRAKSFFTDNRNDVHHHPPPKPALSEHSTSSPPTSSNRLPHFFHSPPLAAISSAAHAHIADVEAEAEANQDEDMEDEEDQEEDEDDEQEAEEEEDDEEVDSDSETDTRRLHIPTSGAAREPQGPCWLGTAQVEPIELLQLEMSEDIRIGSPDDGSNNLDSELHMMEVGRPDGQTDRAESAARAWPLLQDISNQLPPPSGAQFLDLTQEDGHYSQTVSTILHRNPGRLADPSSGYYGSSQQSAFSSWESKSDHLLPMPLDGTSQWLLKYALFTVPFLHNKYKDENSPKSRDGDGGSRLRKGTPQDELSANHVLAERRRREKLNERFIILRSLVPFVTKMDKASILGDTIEYVKQLRRRIQDLEKRNRPMEVDHRSKGTEAHKLNNLNDQRSIQSGGGSTQAAFTTQYLGSKKSRIPASDKRKLRILEGSGAAKNKVTEATMNNIQVSIIESDALLELECPYRDGLLLEIMQMLRELRLEITAVQSSSNNGVFIAELRAKVKENINGRKLSIVEVKRAIHKIVAQY